MDMDFLRLQKIYAIFKNPKKLYLGKMFFFILPQFPAITSLSRYEIKWFVKLMQVNKIS